MMHNDDSSESTQESDTLNGDCSESTQEFEFDWEPSDSDKFDTNITNNVQKDARQDTHVYRDHNSETERIIWDTGD